MIRHDSRNRLWMEVRRLVKLGFPQKVIAKKLHVSERTVRNYLKCQNPPKKRAKRLNWYPFRKSLENLLKISPQANCTWYMAKLQEAGYKGSLRTLQRASKQVMADMLSRRRKKKWRKSGKVNGAVEEK